MHWSEKTKAAIQREAHLVRQVSVILVRDVRDAFEDLKLCAETVMRCAIETEAPDGYRGLECSSWTVAQQIEDAWMSLSDNAPGNRIGEPPTA